jgi:hypothetical protein
MSKNDTKKAKPVTEKKTPRVTTKIKAGPNRRDHDHIGNFNVGTTIGSKLG